MLLIMCHCSANRFAIDSRHVSEVLPRANLHALPGSPPWFKGMLIYRGIALPVIDLNEITEGKPCPNRMSSRIIVVQAGICGKQEKLGVLAARVSLHEVDREPELPGNSAELPVVFGRLCIDEQGVFQLVDVPRLMSEERRTFLFPAAEKDL
jgi:chemotaxis-related protein WspB